MKEDPQFYLMDNGTDTSSCGRNVSTACRTLSWLLGVFYNESHTNSTRLPTLNMMLGTSLHIGHDTQVRCITFSFNIAMINYYLMKFWNCFEKEAHVL